MEDITDWVPAYGFDATNARTRTLLFIEDKKEQMLDLYYQFLNHAYGGRYRNPSMRALFYDTLTGEREPIYYQSAITFMVSRVIGKPIETSMGERDQHLDSFVDWLLEKNISIAERIPERLSDDSRQEIEKIIVNQD